MNINNLHKIPKKMRIYIPEYKKHFNKAIKYSNIVENYLINNYINNENIESLEKNEDFKDNFENYLKFGKKFLEEINRLLVEKSSNKNKKFPAFILDKRGINLMNNNDFNLDNHINKPQFKLKDFFGINFDLIKKYYLELLYNKEITNEIFYFVYIRNKTEHHHSRKLEIDGSDNIEDDYKLEFHIKNNPIKILNIRQYMKTINDIFFEIKENYSKILSKRIININKKFYIHGYTFENNVLKPVVCRCDISYNNDNFYFEPKQIIGVNNQVNVILSPYNVNISSDTHSIFSVYSKHYYIINKKYKFIKYSNFQYDSNELYGFFGDKVEENNNRHLNNKHNDNRKVDVLKIIYDFICKYPHSINNNAIDNNIIDLYVDYVYNNLNDTYRNNYFHNLKLWYYSKNEYNKDNNDNRDDIKIDYNHLINKIDNTIN